MTQTYPIIVLGLDLENVVSDGELLRDGLDVVLLEEVRWVGIAYHIDDNVAGGRMAWVGRVIGSHSQLSNTHANTCSQ